MATVGEGPQKRYVSFRATKHEREAIELERRGFETLKRVVIISRVSKYEDAVVYFQQAADLYKADGKWRKAGECYTRAADAELQMENTLTAATFFVDAAEVFYRVDPLDAVRFYESAISLYAKVGRFSSAARVQRQIAEIHEEDEAWEAAAEAYQLAADFYSGEHMFTQAIACLGQSGLYMAEAGRYDEAVDRFTAAGTMCRDDNMLKFNSPGHLLNAVLCWLCSGDVESALEQFEESMAVDFYFAGSRHAKFAAHLIEATADFNIHEYMDHVWNFDNVEPFTPMQLSLLERLAQLILEGPPREGDDASSHGATTAVGDEEGSSGSEYSDESSYYSDDDDSSVHSGSQGSTLTSTTRRDGGTTTMAGTTTVGSRSRRASGSTHGASTVGGQTARSDGQ